MTIARLRRLEDLVSLNSNVHVLISVGKNQRSILYGVADLKLESLFRRTRSWGTKNLNDS